ncbi:MAG: M28 family peptidase [Amphiplicatus sp.]
MMAARFLLMIACAAACLAARPALALDAEARSALAAAAAPEAADRIKADLAYLADDRRKGREAGTQGHLDAARYVAARMEAIGLAPGAEGDWFQQVKLRTARRESGAARMTLIAPDGRREGLVHLKDFLIGQFFGQPEVAVTAPAIFVGYGVADETSGYDDYLGLDARGKIVVVFDGAPRSFDSDRRAHFASDLNKRATAAARGAVGFILIRTKEDEERRPWSKTVGSAEDPAMTFAGDDGAAFGATPRIVAGALMSHDGAEKLFDGALYSYKDLRRREEKGAPLAGFDLPRAVRLSGVMSFNSVTSPNVVGLIEGRDPILAKEAVALTAHLDHIGAGPPKAGEDRINNGALDNALGVAILLDVARALAAAQPRRSIVIVATTAEEKGLLGAGYYASHPGEKRIVADINIDMPTALYDFSDIVAIGAERSTLGALVDEAASEMGVAVTPDPFPELGIFTRSDHYRFVERGIPSVFILYGYGNGGEKIFKNFMKNAYHKPTDDISLPINYPSAARFSALGAHLARKVADADAAPVWAKGDFFGEIFAKPEAGGD